jgi:beta-ribofuranosylaminobenzene 5'-phosphate synthase
VLLQLLPALAQGDVADFGAALTEIQRINGEWFAAAQGGVYAPGESARLVQQLREGGAAGVGQSSWGPTVYGLTADAVTARQLAAGARALIGSGGAVYEGRFSPHGARVGWEKPPATVEQSSFRAS